MLIIALGDCWFPDSVRLRIGFEAAYSERFARNVFQSIPHKVLLKGLEGDAQNSHKVLLNRQCIETPQKRLLKGLRGGARSTASQGVA